MKEIIPVAACLLTNETRWWVGVQACNNNSRGSRQKDKKNAFATFSSTSIQAKLPTHFHASSHWAKVCVVV